MTVPARRVWVFVDPQCGRHHDIFDRLLGLAPLYPRLAIGHATEYDLGEPETRSAQTRCELAISFFRQDTDVHYTHCTPPYSSQLRSWGVRDQSSLCCLIGQFLLVEAGGLRLGPFA